MSDTYTFQDKHNKYKLTVKSEFLKQCAAPDQFAADELNKKYSMFRFLHNPNGPAIVRFKDNREEYWLDGIRLDVEDPEKAERIKHGVQFQNRLDKTLNEVDTKS